MLRRRVKPDVADVNSSSQRHTERLNRPIKVLVIHGIFIMPDPRRGVGYFACRIAPDLAQPGLDLRAVRRRGGSQRVRPGQTGGRRHPQARRGARRHPGDIRRHADGRPPGTLFPVTARRVGLRSGLAEDAVEVGAADRAGALGHPAAVRLDDAAFGLALRLALHAVELALVGLGGVRHLASPRWLVGGARRPRAVVVCRAPRRTRPDGLMGLLDPRRRTGTHP